MLGMAFAGAKYDSGKIQVDKKLPVLICGAGPSGLTLALELARRGIPVSIFDKASGPAPMQESRALAFNPRSRMILEPSGVTAKILACGHVINTARFMWQGKLLADVDACLPSRPECRIISIPQGRVERILLEAVEALGVSPHWNTEMTGFAPANEGITTTLRSGNKQREVSGQYLVGCDGAHSITRKTGGYSFEGETSPQTWGMADVILPDSSYAHRITADFFPGSANAAIAIGERHMRLIRAGRTDIEDHPLYGMAAEVLWRSQFTVSYRMVRQFSRGKTFLCGDAAHIHSPVGGRGMNLGIEDAATLAYLMSKGREGEYSDSRLPVARKVLAFTHTQTRQLLSTSPVNHFLKQHALPYLVRLPFARHAMLRAILAFDTPPPEWL